MSGDRLADAVRALREGAESGPARPDQTRARVLASLRKRPSSRLRIVKAVLPLAAVLVGSTAWAAATGRLPSDWPAVATLLGVERPAVAPPWEQPASNRVARAAETPPEQGLESRATVDEQPAGGMAATVDEPPAIGMASAARSPHRGTPGAAPISAGAGPRAPGSPDRGAAARPSGENAPEKAAPPAIARAAEADPEGETLYAAAHRLHFVERNPGAALGAWDAYLRAAPRGRFSVEAHYNRALCLVRLGRSTEARRALEPFARGAAGGYRQTEASSLLEAMGSAAP
jgi:hypothetical protein